MTQHPVVPRKEWLDARKRHLEHEKEMTGMRDRAYMYLETTIMDWIRRHDEYPESAPRGLP
ncbi:DUF899 family protein [Devosia nitrariae]|uniref:Uncharacterized protein n=1 Tax=Devosia nitrariae TaxID=2071872 RepID=A0ABQ5W1E3_9HYPH|nr:DUF899 family protein [Devosia nitrariae]GLQ53889.1 hypothetical protein GCM10010862_11480 [Devosia nitrariae]